MDRSPASSAPLRVLTVGNSFAYDATRFLPELAASVGRRLALGHANNGGASLERHLEFAARSEADPGFNPYDGRTLREALEAARWDIVTIQQASALSHVADSYEPHATRLIALIRRHAPTAETVVHQTWAYRADYPGFADGTLTPSLMHERIAANYDTLAARHGLRLLPVGAAFHAALRNPRFAFHAGLDPAFDYQNPRRGAMPRPCGGLHMGWSWIVNPEGREVFWHDYLHANDAGRYLAACVWLALLFDASPETASFAPPSLSPEDATELRALAHRLTAEPRAPTTR